MTSALRLALVVAVLSASSSARAQDEATVEKGKATYQYWCATCHGSGPGQPGTTALTAKYKGQRPGLLEERTDLSVQGVRFAVRRGISIMPFFRKTELTDADLEAVARYLTRSRASTPGPDGRRP